MDEQCDPSNAAAPTTDLQFSDPLFCGLDQQVSLVQFFVVPLTDLPQLTLQLLQLCFENVNFVFRSAELSALVVVRGL